MNRIIAVGFAAFLLSACHHDYPLKTHNQKENLLFLINASANSEKRLHLPVKEGDRGVIYLECMEGKKDKEINCTALYQTMISFAREGHYQGYESITLPELTDHKVFDELADDYLETLADTWPTYY